MLASSEGFLSPWWRDCLIVAITVIVLGLVVSRVFASVWMVRHERQVRRYVLATEEAIALVGEYARLFKEEGSDTKKMVQEAAEKVDKVKSVVAEAAEKVDKVKSMVAPEKGVESGSFPVVPVAGPT